MEDYHQSYDQYSDLEFEEEEVEGEEVMEESEEEEEEEVMEDREIEFDSWDMLERMLKKKISTGYEVMWKCLRFCYLFPKSCEFQKDDMVQLWMAQGFFPLPSHGEVIEDTVGLHFEEFERCQIFQLSRQYYSTPELRYRLNNSIVHLLQQQQDDEYVRIGDSNSQISENTLHCSLPGSSITPITLNNLYQAKRLSTLLIYHQPRVDRIPRQLFLKLPLLRVLDFSHTNITELPSSIANLKQLWYLNLSVTPITTLPEALCSLYQMRTLKLRGCLKLVGLPDDMRKLVNLHHLELELACLLVSMPPGLGDLTELQSLPAFVVGKESGCQITELKNMVNLHGTLRILKLENVASSEEAKEAALDVKIHLHKLELQWTELDDDFEVLENLKPHLELGEFQIVGYGGAKFPSWIGDPSFSKLVTITIHDCRNLQLLPPLGKLPFLRDLCISEIHEVEVIDHQFFGRNMDANVLDLGSHELGKVSGDLSDGEKYTAFPLLEKLTLYGLPKLKKWTGIEEGDFPCLQKMNVSGCPKLTALTELSLCKSLQLLEISACSSLESFPDEGLPTSLEYLVIIDCPLLKEWCHGDKGAMLARIPTVWLDYQQISRETTSNQAQNMEQTKSMQAPQQLNELIHVEVTELQPHLEGNKKLKDVEIPKGVADMDSKTQPKAFETSSEDDAEYEGATTRRAVIKEIVELRLQQLYDSIANQSCNKLSSFHAEFGIMMKKLDVMRSFLNQNSAHEEDEFHIVESISAGIGDFVYEADDIVLDGQILADNDVKGFDLKNVVYDIDVKGFRLRIERMLEVADMIERDINRWNKYRDPENQMTLTRNKGIIGRSHSKATGLIDDILIGDVQKIKGWILTDEKSTQIAIHGKGGLGKTTLARTICKDYDVRHYFDRLIWVTVSTPFSETDILRSFLIQLNSHDDNVTVMSRIKRSLSNKKYLIVMEGVWMMDYDWWRMLLEHLPAECNRSIIITTTDEEVARNMGVTYFHRARNLDENESWSLLCDVAFSADQKRNLNSEFETVGKDIVKKCKGILLAIKAVAGLLATKTESPVQWEMVNSNFRVNNNESIVRAILELSYDDLPAMLKHCILCFSIYPYGTVIDAEQLIYWWVGEGFVQGDDRKTAIEVAFQCLSQLVSRCLVEVDHNNRGYDRMMYKCRMHDMFDHYRGYDGRIYKCRMHDMFDHYRGYDGRIYKCRMHKLVRDFIIGKSRIEGFSSFDDKGCRHLGYTSKMDKEILGNNPKLRAFLSVEDVSPSKFITGPASIKSREDASALKLEMGSDRIKSLRVLDLSLGWLRVDVVDLLSFIKAQKRLAYLNLKRVFDLTELPDWIKEHRNLKILVLNNLESLPSSITTLHNLLVLDVTGCYRLKLPPGFGGLTKLQVLRGFRVSKELNNLAELRELKNLAELRELTIDLPMFDEIGDGEEYFLSQLFDESADGEEYFLSQLSKLKLLTIRNVWGALVNRLKPPPSLKELNLESFGLVDTTTPDWLTPASLPKLVYLNIEWGRVEGFNPSFWEGNGEGWRIEGLRFYNLPLFELDWEVVKSNMKYLRYAEVKRCPGLRSFPLDASNSGVWEKKKRASEDCRVGSRLQIMERERNKGKHHLSE